MRIHVHCIELSIPEFPRSSARFRGGPTVMTVAGALDSAALEEFTTT
ncbi:hypothetical protein [Rhodococcus gannanensis]|uniref:Uncharacterized protein n=1 Tax=Rhodococcus gannanensis TaxID=1960308 RepID=A0ABW4NXV9_9NOCA